MIFGPKIFKKSPSSLKGIVCMLGGALALTINDAMAKFLTQSYPVGQVMALRGLSILILLMVFLFFINNLKALKINSWRSHFLRAGTMTGSTVFFCHWSEFFTASRRDSNSIYRPCSNHHTRNCSPKGNG